MKRALIILGFAIAALGALGLRVVLEGRAALAKGDAALAAKHPAEAIAAWQTAARWYLPGAPHVDEAYGRLVELAEASKADRPQALAAWRAVRTAALATRSLWTPHADQLAAANAAIAQLSADDPEGSLISGDTNAARRTWHAARLARDPRPAAAAIALAIAGIAGWLIGLGWLVRRGIDDAGRLVRRRAWIGLAIAVAGFVGWAAGLYIA
ncbi:MAG: hypothetical protein ACTHU0_24485 [Kofleriaceae bacterium]